MVNCRTFNSWDRQPFLVERDGQSTFVPVTREITKNLWINNYNPQEATDNDDGSCWYVEELFRRASKSTWLTLTRTCFRV